MAVYRPSQPSEREVLENRRLDPIGQANRLDRLGGYLHQVDSHRREAASLRSQAAAIQEQLIRHR